MREVTFAIFSDISRKKKVEVVNDSILIVDQIRSSEANRSTAIRALVGDDVLRQKIRSYILTNSGEASDAETIFHDAIVAFVKTVFTKKEFRLTTHLHGYLLGVARNLWMNELRRKKKNHTVSIDHASTSAGDTDTIALLLKGERGKILKMVLDVMRKKCKEVLMHWASGFKMVEIAEKLGYKNAGVAKKKKSECMKELYGYLRENPHIKERIRPQ